MRDSDLLWNVGIIAAAKSQNDRRNGTLSCVDYRYTDNETALKYQMKMIKSENDLLQKN